jgi:sugar lactone lactonase YvrE
MSALALSAGASAWAGEEVTVDGVPHIKNVATPSQGRETLKLEEIWRVGGDNEDDLLLALITEVCRDEKGNIYALDSQLCNVHVFSPQGELLRTLFAQGEGPGETLRPRDLVVTKDGVGVAEEFPSKVIMVDREGLPLDNVYLTTQEGENLGALMGAGFGGGNLILSGVEVTQGDTPGTQNRLYFLGCFSDTGKERFRYCESSSQYNFQKYSFVEKEHIPSFWWGFEVAPDGTVYAACDRENYAISVFSPDGKLVRVIEREFQPYTRTEKDKKWMHDLIASATGELPFEVKYVFEDNEPVIDFFHRGLRIDGDGNLWVTTSRGLRDNASLHPAGCCRVRRGQLLRLPVLDIGRPGRTADRSHGGPGRPVRQRVGGGFRRGRGVAPGSYLLQRQARRVTRPTVQGPSCACARKSRPSGDRSTHPTPLDRLLRHDRPK